MPCFRAVAIPAPSSAPASLTMHLLPLSLMTGLLHLQGSSSRSSATPAHSCAPASLSTSTCRAPTPCSTTSQSTTSSWGWARAWHSASGGPCCCELHLIFCTPKRCTLKFLGCTSLLAAMLSPSTHCVRSPSLAHCRQSALLGLWKGTPVDLRSSSMRPAVPF